MAALISPSKITAWLECAHTLTLQHRAETGSLVVDGWSFGEMAEMLLAKGQQHEDAVLARYEAAGKSILRVPQRITPDNPAPADAGGVTADDFSDGWEPFASWVERVGNPLSDGWDVVYQLPMIHDGVRGVADFLVRVDASERAPEHYEAVDAKLARQAAKPGHVLQLCFYADALEALTGHRGEFIHLELGSGATETIRLAEVAPYWRRTRRQLVRALAAAPTANTVAEPCNHCNFCEFASVCDAEWRQADSLVYVAGIRAADRKTLADADVATMAALAATDADASIDVTDLERLVRQADLQVQTRSLPDGTPPSFELLDGDATTDSSGYAALPAPDAGDVFLDFEGHPFWKPDAGLFFLFGLIERSDGATTDDDWTFVSFWAHDEGEEATATQALVEYLGRRRQMFPNMHVYHYNHTERSALERLTIEHGVAELELEHMIATGLFVDLFAIVKGAARIGTETYGLKHVEQLTAYVRGHDIDQGAGAVVEYERWMSEPDRARRDQRMLERIAAYNEDDVRATRAVRDWLVAHRPADTEWRVPVLELTDPDPELDRRIEALHDFDADSPEHRMGDLLGYWRRERRAVAADAFRLSIADEVDQLASSTVITGLSFQLLEDQFSEKTGKQLKWPAAVFTYPEQPIGDNIEAGTAMIEAIDEQEWSFFKVAALDRQARRLRLHWDAKHQESGRFPKSVVEHETFQEGAKLDALAVLADQMLAGDATRVGHAILRRDPPRFIGEQAGPSDRVFTGEIDEICRWATQLDHSCVAIQGPPGTGKTYAGAHIIRALVNAGQRVGVTAMTHLANDNLMAAVVDCFERAGQAGDLRAVRKHSVASVPGVSYVNDNTKAAEGDYDVISGTPWLHASQAMRDHPVDVLVIDEAGQLGLADAIAASISATNVILLGDPQQLPQVSQASHPNGTEASSIEHLLGGAPTMPVDRGVFLGTTRRMHSDVNRFISDVMYEGRVAVHRSCDLQTTPAGTGLRWMRVVHDGCDTSSRLEAERIAEQLKTLMDKPWTNQYGETVLLRPADFMIVAPYNDQVRMIRTVLSSNKRTAKVEVGTVDRFQGREAAVVFYSMATSSAEHMPRNADFLFSKNRLNVAISRARCLAYVVCTDKLLATRATTVEEMKMIGALCSFVERATEV
jgi:predicted RecB family nuclease